jgi:hypothetical protein
LRLSALPVGVVAVQVEVRLAQVKLLAATAVKALPVLEEVREKEIAVPAAMVD